MASTQYTAVIATRNRTDALRLSLPLLLGQSRPPCKVVVIDSSDEPEHNAALVSKLGERTSIPLVYETSLAGSSLQRNIGLQHVDSDVVFFPDDDSLVHPEALATMMHIYDLDTEKRIGGVCGIDARYPPPGVLSGGEYYRMTPADRMRAAVSNARTAIENRLAPDPFILAGQRKYEHLPPPPPWLSGENAVTVPSMAGFRMSFRTESIRRRPFCEDLGRYALFEDTDASFGVLDSQFIVAALDAQIYHHKAPGVRANGRALGAMQILNRVFVVARSGIMDEQLAVITQRYALYKIAQYGSAAPVGGRFARERLSGAVAARREVPSLLSAAPSRLTQSYLAARKRALLTE